MERTVNRSIRCPQIIGRTPEFAALGLLMEQVRARQGPIAPIASIVPIAPITLIAGEAGIGKSRLVNELKATAQDQGFLVVQGACFPTDLTYPYAPLLDLLRSLVARNPSTLLTAAVEALAHDIYPLLPELVPDQTIPTPRLEPEQEKRRLFSVLTTFFLHLSTQAPLLLVIEDLHWSDDTSLDFLHTLARHSISQPLLLLATYRHDEVHPPLRNWLTQLNRERLAHELQLVPLARNEVDKMLSAIFEEQHTSFDMRRFLHGELLEALYMLTEGNPFFVEETISSLIAANDIFYAQGYWHRTSGRKVSIPQSVQDAVHLRTAQLSAAARHVLTLAAVAGRHFDFALLQQLTRHDEQQLLLLMKELVSAQLVVEESADQFAFRHALTRQAIYLQLLTRERRMLHRTIGETIEHLASSSAPDMHLGDLAYHFYQAGIWEKAGDYAQRAGEKALQLYSHRAAIDYFTCVLESAAHLSLTPAPALYRARGQAFETLGEFDQAQQDYTRALDAARQLNQPTAEWQSAIDLGFLWAGRDYAQAEIWFRQALNLSQSLADPALHAHSLNRIGNWHLNVEQTHEALRYHHDALAIFQQLHDARGIAETLDLMGMTCYLGGDLIGGTAYYQQAIALFRELEDKPGLTSSLATLTMRGPSYQTDSLVAVASLAEASLDAEDALKIAREIGRRPDETYALLQLGLCLASHGEYGRAFTALRQSLQIAEEIEHRQWQTAAHAILGGVYCDLFALPQAREHAEQALTLARENGSLTWTLHSTGYLASAVIQLHDFAQAEKLIHAVLSPATPAETIGQRMVMCASVELALAQGNPTHALALIDQLVASHAPVAQGKSSLRILKLLGETLLALHRPVEAETALTEARLLAASLGARSRQWRICISLGKLYQSQGRNTEAEQAFATARTLIEQLATTITSEPLRDNFLQLATAQSPPSRPPSPRQAAKQAYGGLTAREREIAALIARGNFNREIADILVLSERTIETHVSNIMLKLNFTSRRQIATWANEKGLTPNT